MVTVNNVAIKNEFIKQGLETISKELAALIHLKKIQGLKQIRIKKCLNKRPGKLFSSVNTLREKSDGRNGGKKDDGCDRAIYVKLG
ncbi:hypothetical protein [Coleofasciculus sp. FACHB-1120]|uniref:hypothetical protein n=1 Tax=Coleofasciculus sp. FACHB-1120 TaxID=2692783 RepID=UPI001683185A|nr:hypothetical protein [Coleofasciculus sp. FACHB-1120]MBD2741621.1 hypothetical protein [Coleofasciculus sp. FACHB-1120]